MREKDICTISVYSF